MSSKMFQLSWGSVVRMAHLLLQSDHEHAARAVLEDFNRRRIDPGQRLGGDDLVGPAHGHLAMRDVQDVVDMWKERVDVMRDKKGCDGARVCQIGDELNDQSLVAHIEL